jgi:predicted  nucleic acid-binding Zn-ribbon protein
MIFRNADDEIGKWAVVLAKQSELKDAQLLLESLQQDLVRLEFEHMKAEESSTAATDLGQLEKLSHERLARRAKGRELQTKIAHAQLNLEDLTAAAGQLRLYCEALVSQRVNLFRDLGTTRNPEEHVELKGKLLDALAQIASLSGSVDLRAQKQYESFRKEYEAGLNYITLKQGYVFDNGGRGPLVPESRQQSSHGITAFGRGVRLDKHEAAKLGIDKMEAA